MMKGDIVVIIIVVIGIAMLLYVFWSMAVPFGRSLLEEKVEGPKVEMTSNSALGVPMPKFSTGNVGTIVARALQGFLGILGASIPGLMTLWCASKFNFSTPEHQRTEKGEPEPVYRVYRTPTDSKVSAMPEVSALKTLNSRVLYI